MTYENSQFNNNLNNELLHVKKIVSRPRKPSYKQLIIRVNLATISFNKHADPFNGIVKQYVIHCQLTILHVFMVSTDWSVLG